jgi:hypothetical protein
MADTRNERAVRLPVELLERAEALAPNPRRDPNVLAIGRFSRSAAVRLLLLRGIEAAEADARRKAARA